VSLHRQLCGTEGVVQGRAELSLLPEQRVGLGLLISCARATRGLTAEEGEG
jgi:hypothetical protein